MLDRLGPRHEQYTHNYDQASQRLLQAGLQTQKDQGVYHYKQGLRGPQYLQFGETDVAHGVEADHLAQERTDERAAYQH